MNLRDLRRERGVNQASIAAALGTTASAVSHFERRPNPTLDTLVEHVAAMGGNVEVVAAFGRRRYEIDLPVLAPREPRRMRVIWQNPISRSFRHVADLLDDGRRYRFTYVDPLPEDFSPFPDFPDARGVYEAVRPWPFFAERSVDRAPTPETGEDVVEGASPSLTLAEFAADDRTHGGVVQLVPALDLSQQAADWPFLVSGVSHAVDDDAAVEAELRGLNIGDELTLRRDFGFDRAESPARELMSGGRRIGWVPDYAVEAVHAAERRRVQFKVEVLAVGLPGGNPHLRVLCRLKSEQVGNTRAKP